MYIKVAKEDFKNNSSWLPIEEVGYMDYEYDYNDGRRLAKKYHGEQMYGKYPYTKHLNDVEQVLRRFGYDPDTKDLENKYDIEYMCLAWDLITAAWLHDIVEDTQVTSSDISRRFNHRVAGLVHAVTNPQGGNRAWRASKVYPKIINTPNALILKLADRIANVESCVSTGSSLINMYAKEWDGFKSKYRVKGEHEEMWRHIDRLIKENRSFRKPKRGRR